jgi:NADPH2:quinone reductase
MRAAVVTEVGRPPRPGDVPAPAAGDGQALVSVTAAPLNPIEIRIAAGRFARRPQVPYVPGGEGVGTLAQDRDGFAAGTRVRFETPLPGWGANGGLAELAAVYADSLVELPDAAGDALAAAIGTVGITAWMALERAALQAGETVLVLGATGAVGQAAVQLAKLQGAGRVVAAGRDGDALRRAAELGADATVDLAADSLTDAFRDAAVGDLDVVIDPLWGEPAIAAMEGLAFGGRLVNVGEQAGSDVALPLAHLRNRQAVIHCVSTGWQPLDAKREAYIKVLSHALAGELEVDLEVVPFSDVASAWERQARSPGRKLVIDLRER